ncbi:uncharacterized protein G2W53_010324 [Senna tora]|uniref:Uncharacterized protein n=1 Tax=Senna tora TaxID=362788 RepID=A0A834X0G6_9FABA|nr:uncharacterized protein G2W53_010324 [Senna tora]
MIHAPRMPRLHQLGHQNHSGSRTNVFDSLAQQVFCLVIREGFRDPTAICRPGYVGTLSTLLPCQDDSNWGIKTPPVSKIRLRSVLWGTLRHDPSSYHAKTNPIGASKPLRFANTTRTDVFDSLAQQLFCLAIREGFLDPTAICRPEYVETRSTLLPCQDDSNWSIRTTPVREPTFLTHLRNKSFAS